MKKITFIFFCVLLTSTSWSQVLHVGAATEITITPKAYVYAGSDVEIIATGSIRAESDATHSASFLAPNGESNVTGDITYDRYIQDNNWHFVSAPVKTQSIKSFGDNAINDIAKNGTKYAISIYKNQNVKYARWSYYLDNMGSDVNFENGRGYSIKRNSAGIFTFTGSMATESNTVVVIPVDPILGGAIESTATTVGSHMWSSLGNPFPSFINGQSLLAANLNNLDPQFNSINVWNGSEYSVINFSTASAYLAPGQGFMVDPKLNNTNFVFPENLQTIQTDISNTFYKSEAIPTITVSLSDGSKTNNTTIKYFSNTTKGLDIGWDAGTYKAAEANSSLTIDTHLINESIGTDFTIQCLSKSEYDTSIVPLSVSASKNKTITFSTVNENLPEGIKVYLEDKINNTITDITTNPYSITISAALNGIGNFYLHTSSSVLSIDNSLLVGTSLNIYKYNNSTLRIAGLKSQGKNAIVKIYSITGKEILKKHFLSKNVYDISIPTNLSTGLYIVNVVSDNNEYTKKIILE